MCDVDYSKVRDYLTFKNKHLRKLPIFQVVDVSENTPKGQSVQFSQSSDLCGLSDLCSLSCEQIATEGGGGIRCFNLSNGATRLTGI